MGGALGFYQGVTVSAGGNAVEKFIYFFAYFIAEVADLRWRATFCVA